MKNAKTVLCLLGIVVAACVILVSVLRLRDYNSRASAAAAAAQNRAEQRAEAERAVANKKMHQSSGQPGNRD